MNLILRASRALISAAVTVHLFNLRTSVVASDRRFQRAINASDDAATAVRVARSNQVVATGNEKIAARAHGALLAAAQAEARTYRRDAVVI